MTIFKNFENQSQYFMTIFSILYNHIWYHSSRQYKTIWAFSSASSAHLTKIKEHTRAAKMDKKRPKITLAALDAVRSTFPKTNESIDSTLKEE